jgi:uncharacterized damage-inducible protein DinB
MYRKISDFIRSWKHESESTLQLFANITDDALNRKDHENVRSIAVLSWHITTTIPEMMGKAGLKVSGADEHSKPPAGMKEIAQAYKTCSSSLISELEKTWNDNQLEEELPMYGETWSKGQILSVLILHQAHHRGQLSVLVRQAGLKVPGIYGPAKEDWAMMNMPAMD